MKVLQSYRHSAGWKWFPFHIDETTPPTVTWDESDMTGRQDKLGRATSDVQRGWKRQGTTKQLESRAIPVAAFKQCKNSADIKIFPISQGPGPRKPTL